MLGVDTSASLLQGGLFLSFCAFYPLPPHHSSPPLLLTPPPPAILFPPTSTLFLLPLSLLFCSSPSSPSLSSPPPRFPPLASSIVSLSLPPHVFLFVPRSPLPFFFHQCGSDLPFNFSPSPLPYFPLGADVSTKYPLSTRLFPLPPLLSLVLSLILFLSVSIPSYPSLSSPLPLLARLPRASTIGKNRTD